MNPIDQFINIYCWVVVVASILLAIVKVQNGESGCDILLRSRKNKIRKVMLQNEKALVLPRYNFPFLMISLNIGSLAFAVLSVRFFFEGKLITQYSYYYFYAVSGFALVSYLISVSFRYVVLTDKRLIYFDYTTAFLVKDVPIREISSLKQTPQFFNMRNDLMMELMGHKGQHYFRNVENHQEFSTVYEKQFWRNLSPAFCD